MYDVGLIQLREWLRSGRVKDGGVDYVPSSGDLLAVGYLDGRRVHGDSQVFVRSTDFDVDHAIIFESLGYEIWRVVDDCQGLYCYRRCNLCGRWELAPCVNGICWLCEESDEYLAGMDAFEYSAFAPIVDENRKEERHIRLSGLDCGKAATLEALHQLRQAGSDSPIHYDVMRYNSAAGKFQCVGSNLRFWEAHDMVRRYERGGFVSFLRESVTCRG